MENFIDWITFLCSVVIASIISLITYFTNLKKHKDDVITQAITVNRIEWIANVRKLIGEFLSAYMTGKSKKELNMLRMQIELYIRKNSDYSRFSSALKKCCDEDYTEDNLNELIEASQTVLHRVWRRIKIEGGQSKKDDERIRKLIDEYENGN